MRAVFIALFFSLLCGRAGAHFTEPRLLGEGARPFTQATTPGEARGFKDERLGLTEETNTEVLWAGWLPVMEERTRTVSGITGVTTRRWFQWGADLSGTLDGAGGIGGLVGIIEEDGAGVVTRTLLPVQDGLGNITAVIDQATGRTVARYDYGPFGEALAESGEVDACPFRWQTKWYDAESQHYYFGYRHYDPRFGRWLSRDPLGEAGGFNLYEYCGNDPVNRHDPLGLAPLYGVDGQTREAMLRIEDERERKERRDNYRNPDAWKIIYLPVALAGIPIAAAALPEIVLASEAAVYSAPVIAFGEFTAAGGLTTLGAKAALITAAAVIGFEAGSGASVSDALQDGGTVGLNIWAATGFGNPNARLPNFGWSGLPLLRDALAAKSRMTTVLGSLDDVAKFKGKPGYNVLDVPDAIYKKMSPAEFDRLNADWLNAALRRGDRIMSVTDPAAHAQFLERIRPGLSSQSRYLNLELPMLEEFGAIVPKQISYPPVTPFIVNP